jgi:hypothetical protein
VKLASGVSLPRSEKVGMCVHDLALAAQVIPHYSEKSSGKLG